jgi:undecaprenyl-phosphate 4-deoxy-4-formamido-L-arabinose transferase
MAKKKISESKTSLKSRARESADDISISVVVPTYNSEGSLGLLVERLEPVLSRLTPRFELILVDDGSKDRTWDVIEELAIQYSWIAGINLMRNFGQHNAVLCGVRQAALDIIVTLDDDLQNPPEEIPRLIEKLGEGYDVVYGTPEQEQHGIWRNAASQVTKLALQSAMGEEEARKVGAFRAFRTGVREAFAAYGGSFVNLDVLLSWATTRFSSVTVTHQPRHIGKSNYTFWNLARHAINMITGFSMVPLQIASFTGFVFTFFGILVLFYVIGRYFLQGGVVPGFPFLASIIAIFSGAQLFSLGIMGEYLARMYFRLMERPTYVIKKTVLPRAR